MIIDYETTFAEVFVFMKKKQFTYHLQIVLSYQDSPLLTQ